MIKVRLKSEPTKDREVDENTARLLLNAGKLVETKAKVAEIDKATGTDTTKGAQGAQKEGK